MEADLQLEVEQLETLDLEGLRAAWGRRYGAPPSLRSVAILRRLIAWRLQADALGGLDADTRKALRRKGRVQPEGFDLGLGARLTRSWQGREVVVVVTADGFCWEDRLYPSLSAAASAIAGSRWNGPRFFGLRSEV